MVTGTNGLNNKMNYF